MTLAEEKVEEEELPDLMDKDVQMATKKIQLAFRAKKPKFGGKFAAKVKVEPPVAVPLPVPGDLLEEKLSGEKSSPERLSEAKSLSIEKTFGEKSLPDADGSNCENSSADR